jgi:hypothetical protein
MATSSSSTNCHRLLAIIGQAEDGVNWYKLGRAHLHEFESPPDLNDAIMILKDSGLIEEKTVANESLPRLFITAAGKVRLKSLIETHVVS